MSPIQFQKLIRLQEARLRLASGPVTSPASASRSATTVPSQFSREYRRQFGRPPGQDAARLRTLAQVT